MTSTESTKKAENARPSVAISEENLAALLRATTGTHEVEAPPPQPAESAPPEPTEAKLALIAAIRKHRSAILRSEASTAPPASPPPPIAAAPPLVKDEPTPEPPALKITPLQPLPPAAPAAKATSPRRLIIGLIVGVVILVSGVSISLLSHGKSKPDVRASSVPATNSQQQTSQSALLAPLPEAPSRTSSEPVAPPKETAETPAPRPSHPQPKAFTAPPSVAQPFEQRAILDAPPAMAASAATTPVIGLTPALPALSGDASTPRQIRVESTLQSANLIHKVTPAYPSLAKAASIQGTVRFTAVIGKDGRIQNLKANSGPPLLIDAAAGAVKQWIYRPTLLNGEPVEVITQIDVTFTSSR